MGDVKLFCRLRPTAAAQTGLVVDEAAARVQVRRGLQVLIAGGLRLGFSFSSSATVGTLAFFGALAAL